MFCKTIRIKCITPNAVKRNALFLTMRRARKCANYIVQEAFNKKLLNATAINNATYQNCTRYNLPTGLVQTARNKVVEACTWKPGHG